MYIDFMGTDAAIFRSLTRRNAVRTDQHNSKWLSGESARQQRQQQHSSAAPKQDFLSLLVLRLMWSTQTSMLSLFFSLEPIFVDAHLIPDGTDPNDAKLYFFFRERLTDNSGNTKNIHTMVARVCPVSS